MDDSKEPRELSLEEISVNQILEDASKQIETLEAQLRNLPSDKGPEPRPTGTPASRPYGSRKQAEYRLRTGIEQVKTEAASKADKVLEKASPELQFTIGQKIEDWKNPTQKEANEEKTLQQSQSFMSRLMLSRKGNFESKDGTEKTEKPKERIETQFPTISTRFSQTLHYNTIKKDQGSNKDDGPSAPEGSKTPEIDRDKDD